MFQEIGRQMQETDRRMQETDRQMQETDLRMQETDRQMQETDRQIKETGRLIKEMGEETDKRLKEMGAETDRRLGRLGNRLGDIVEGLMSPQLDKKFEALGYNFTGVSRNYEIKDYNKQRLAEIDVFLENETYAMAVEVKVRPSTEDVRDHVKRLGILRGVADSRGEKRKYLGAVAGTVVEPKVVDYAVKNGLFVLIPSGDTVNIAVPPDFKPRIW
jgi:hypothetical protein